ncbi:MAG: LacI family transcriptional regulator, partial [Streptococcus thermophilus]|nr:LacI family transcriptional regulator [Streptococcus thermophilus]
IQQPLDEIAKLCVEILLKKIKGEIVSRDYVLPINLISGSSI